MGDTIKTVIPSQCAHWRGNPYPFGLCRENTDCHTSDIGHWFAMTVHFVDSIKLKNLIGDPVDGNLGFSARTRGQIAHGSQGKQF